MTSEEIMLKNTLRQQGYSLTAVRSRVFKALNDQEPLSMNQLVKRVGSRVDRSSIYRTVSLFEKLGIVQRLQIGWKYKLELSDAFHSHHHHLSCQNCGLIIPMREDVMLEATIHSLAKEYGFEALTHQLEIQGTCPQCNTK